jgi:GGDEF domain-containing protein
MSIGVATLDAVDHQSIEDLLGLADKAMYQDKRRKKTGPLTPGPDGSNIDQAVA